MYTGVLETYVWEIIGVGPIATYVNFRLPKFHEQYFENCL
jgi:hypothetical protein